MKIRTRFAPSPTGKMHVGNLRTALYAYLIAKHQDGDFILRIEDTDKIRETEGAIEIIYQTMEAAGLHHDEGPDKDGGVGPYIQSQRHEQGIYLEYAKQLVEKGEAYYCFCDHHRLDALKAEMEANNETYRYDKHCLHLSPGQIQMNLENQVPYVIRQNNPAEGTTTFSDIIYGDITVENKELSDMILIKSDGYPTYNFANVIDDHLMKITHVVRGNEYLSSSPRYNRLYQAFGWTVPEYVHCPLITDQEHKKLSKRLGHSSYQDLIDLGFLNEAIINYVALLGWSPTDNNEMFSLEQLIAQFDYHSINKSPAVFDMGKFRWLNGEYINQMDDQRFYELVKNRLAAIIRRPIDLFAVAMLAKTRIETLNEIEELVDFFQAVPEYDKQLYVHKKMKTDSQNSIDFMKGVLPLLESITDYSVEHLHQQLLDYAKTAGIKNGQLLWPLRTALSGKASTPGGAFDIMSILGKEESLRRIKAGIVKLEAEAK